MYRFKIVYALGKSSIMKIADVTSLNPVQEPEEDEQSTICEAMMSSKGFSQAEGITSVD